MSRVFRGWWVVAGVFVMLLVSAGVGFYGLAVYLRALTVEQGFSLTAVSGATAVFFLVSGLTGIPVAAHMARHDPRPMIALGAVASGLSLAALGRVDQVWQVYVVYAVFGAGFAASSLVPGTTLVTRWFTRRRSVALSIASTGLSAGGVLLTPLVATMIARYDLSSVAPWLGLGLVVGVVPATALLLRASPESMGLLPDGDPAPAAGAPPAFPGTLAVEALRTRFFAAVTLAHLLAMMAQVGGIAHLFNLVAERAEPELASAALALLAVSSLIGRLAGGWFVARSSMRGFALVLMFAQAASLTGLALTDSRGALLVLTAAFGLTVGNLLMLHPLLLAERFGVRDYGRIYSRSQLVATLGVAVGPFAIGGLHDLVGGYGVAFTLAGVASLVAAGVLASSGPTRVPVPVVSPASV